MYIRKKEELQKNEENAMNKEEYTRIRVGEKELRVEG
jgi:hypothetical protein